MEFSATFTDDSIFVAGIQCVVNFSSEVLMVDGHGYNFGFSSLRQLRAACWYDPSYEVIERLVRKNPSNLQIADGNGNLPLHYITQNFKMDYLSSIKLMVDTYPVSVQVQNNDCQTPLHLACQSGLPSPVIEFLIKCYPQALQMKDIHGATPFHKACERGKDMSVIKLLYTAFPLAVRWQRKDGTTPLVTVCRTGSTKIVEYISYECWPLACLWYSKFESLFFTCYPVSKAEVSKQILENVRKEATYALMDVAFHTKHILPDNATAHITQSIMPLCLDNTSKSPTTKPICGQHCEIVLDQSARMNLDDATLLSIVNSKKIKRLLKPEGGHEKLHELLDSVIRMNRAGRAVYLAEDPNNKQQGVKVLHASTTSLDGLFFHVRENPMLCKQIDVGPSMVCRPKACYEY